MEGKTERVVRIAGMNFPFNVLWTAEKNVRSGGNHDCIF